MGKKAKDPRGLAKAAEKKIEKSSLPPPPPPPSEELGSLKLLDQPTLPGTGFKILHSEGFDDGGVADLTLMIDLDDSVQRRKRGDQEYFQALKADLLPRAVKGPMASMTRREQKVSLAQLLFAEEEEGEDKGPSEIYMDQDVEGEDEATMKLRLERLSQARAALRLSLLLREAACTSLSLSELCKRRLSYFGKASAEDALRCAEKALEIAGPGFWDGDEIAIEAEDEVVIDPKYEKNATSPGLENPSVLKYQPIRISHLCQRSALLQRGNALAALGREDEARASYEKILPLLQSEPRCARVDWERHSIYVNIGNTLSRSGDFEGADEKYKLAENLGIDHVTLEGGSEKDGKGMISIVKKNRAFALRRAGKVDEAKTLLREVIEQQMKDDLVEKKKSEEATATDTTHRST